MSSKEISTVNDAKEFDLRGFSSKRDFNCVGPPVPRPCQCGNPPPRPRPGLIGINKKG